YLAPLLRKLEGLRGDDFASHTFRGGTRYVYVNGALLRASINPDSFADKGIYYTSPETLRRGLANLNDLLVDVMEGRLQSDSAEFPGRLFGICRPLQGVLGFAEDAQVDHFLGPPG